MNIHYLMPCHDITTGKPPKPRFYLEFLHNFIVFQFLCNILEYHILFPNPLLLDIPQKWHLGFLQATLHILHLTQHMSRVTLFAE